MDRVAVGDYSLLINSIEGRLDPYVDQNSSSADVSYISNRVFSPTARAPTASKRRIEYSSIDTPVVMDSMNAQELNVSTGKKLRLAVEADELRIQNEQLNEKMERMSSEHERLKEKMERQLVFLDSENNELRAALNRSNDKYFEEKKNWQSKIRSLEADVNLLKKQQSQDLVSSKELRSARAAASNNDEKYLSQIQVLETQLLQKGEEVRHLMKASAKAQEQISKLQQDAVTVRMNSAGDDLGFGGASGGSVSGQSATTRVRELERKCDELESALRKKSRELEKHSAKCENQNILEDEILNLKNKLQLAQGRVSELQVFEGKCQSLVREKEHWTSVLKDAMASSRTLLGSDHDNIVSSGVGDEVGPTGILRLLAATQKRCALVSQNEGKLETQVKELKRTLTSLQSQVKTLEETKTKLTEQYDSSTKSCTRLQQEVKSYENEVKSLRELMRTYDAEFAIGRRSETASASSIVAEKEKIIAGLRRELDSSRETCADLRATIGRVEQRANDLQSQVSRLQQELSAAGSQTKSDTATAVELDYDPSVTKVLHMSQNPSTSFSKNAAEAVSHALATSAVDATAAAGEGIDTSKLHQRLKEAFKERVTAFREAVYLLTGYKVDLLPGSESGSGGVPSSKLRLRSMYAESPEDFLLFQLRGTTLELLDTPYASRLDQRLLAYLTSCNSVPCFLSSVTMDLFDNQTFC